MNKPTKEQAMEAVKTLLQYIGENPEREGLASTPKRVIKSYEELFAGYTKNPEEILSTRFLETANFQDLVLLRSISFNSMCEHHMLPITGKVDIAYVPDNSVVGISKLARIVDVFARRLQIQEKMTAEIAETIQSQLKPLGVAVKISALHHCMSMRGVNKENSIMETMHYTGVFTKNENYRMDFLSLVGK